jgi:spore coat protein U-like protein
MPGTAVMRARLIALLVLLLVPVAARAQCTVTATAVSFGTYLPFSGTPADSTGSVTVGCRLFGPYTVSLNAGLHASGSFSNRRMSSGPGFMSYQLYTNATRTTVWGDGTGGTSVVSAFCSRVCNTNYSVYGRIPARQVVNPGTYTDTILVTVTF